MKENTVFIPNVAVLKIRNLKATLPDDFAQLLSVELLRKPKSYLKRNADGTRKKIVWDRNLHIPMSPMQEMIWMNRIHADDIMFNIIENEIYFLINYSKNFFVRIIQKLKERFFPKKIVLKYIDLQTMIESDDDFRRQYERYKKANHE